MKMIKGVLALAVCACLMGGCGIALRGDTSASSSEMSRAPAVSMGMYAYESLSGEEKAVYDTMAYTLDNYDESARVETLSDDDMKRVFFAVLKDHPEIFWCSSFIRTSIKKGDGTVITEFKPEYTMTKSERYIYQEKIDKTVSSWLAEVPSGASDYLKAKCIYDRIISSVEYDENADEGQNIISVFVNGSSVCTGYSKAFQYLLSKVGIESVPVKGDANGGAHVWNIVRLDGDYYQFDVTWGDPTFSSRKDITDYTDYSYFAVTSEEILRTHTITDEIPMPECFAVKDNYYRVEGKFFESPDTDAVGELIRNADKNGDSGVSFKFATEEDYKKSIEFFSKNNHIFDFYSSAKRVFMYNNDELFIMNMLFR